MLTHPHIRVTFMAFAPIALSLKFFPDCQQIYNFLITCLTEEESHSESWTLGVCSHIITSDWYCRTAVTVQAFSCPGLYMGSAVGTSGYTRVGAGRTGYTWLHAGRSGYTRVNTGRSGYTRVDAGRKGYTWVDAGRSGHTRVDAGRRRYTRVETDTRG
jgi:hypothetical protein